MNFKIVHFQKKLAEALKKVAIPGHLLVSLGGPEGTLGDQWPPGHR